MKKFRGKYRIPSARAAWWNYGWNGAYFITICTHKRRHFFGKVSQKKMILSPLGVIADMCWWEINNHADQVELGEFIIMPNHMHGILILDRPDPNVTGDMSNPDDRDSGDDKNEKMSGISPKSDSVSTIIRSYKPAVSKHAHRLGFEFKWHERFHDHIIRDSDEFNRISIYIRNNPANWEKDKFWNN